MYSYQLAHLLRLDGDHAGADALTARAISTLLAMTRRDPGNIGWRRELAEARIEQSELSRLAGRQADALVQAQSALAALEPLLAERAEDRALVLATNAARLLVAELSPAPDVATDLRQAAIASLDAQRSGLGDPRLHALRRAAERAITVRSKAAAPGKDHRP